MKQTMYRAFVYSATLFLCALGKAAACGTCVHFMVDWNLPFVKWWLLICLVSVPVCLVLERISRDKGKPPTSLSAGEVTGIVIASIFLLFCGPYLLFLVIFLPMWLRSLYQRHRHALSLANRPALRRTILSFQGAVYVALVVSSVYSYATFDNPQRLLGFLECPAPSGQVGALHRLSAMGDDALPVLRTYVDDGMVAGYALEEQVVELVSRFERKDSVPLLIKIAKATRRNDTREKALEALAARDPRAAAELRTVQACRPGNVGEQRIGPAGKSQ